MTVCFSRSFVVMACLLLASCGGDETGTTSEPGAESSSTPTDAQRLEQARLFNLQREYQQALVICNEILAAQPQQIEARLIRAESQVGLSQTELALNDLQAAEQCGADVQQLATLRARVFVAAEDYTSADEGFTLAISAAPDDGDLYAERAMVRAILDQHQAAIDDFSEGIRRNPRAASLYRWRAEESFQLGNFEAAETDLKNALVLEPENPEFYLSRAHFRAELGLADEAVQDYEQALRLDDAPFTHYLRGNFYAAIGNSEAALADLDLATEREPLRAEYYLARANVHLQLQNLDFAKADFHKAIELEPENAHSRLRRAGFLLSKGEIEPAITDLSAAIDLDPGLLTALRMRGITYRMAEQYDDAVADFKLALDRGDTIDDTMRAEMLYQLGMTYQMQDQHAEAIKTFQAATALDRGLATAYFAIAMSQGAEMKFDDAKQSLQAAIDADPDESEFLLARANLYLAEATYQQIVEEGDPAALVEKAHADFRRATEVNSQDDAAWYALAVANASDGRYEESVRNLTTAIGINPDDPRYYQARGDIHLKRQQYAAAIDDFSEALEREPSAELYESRGFAYGELGKKDEAILDFDKAEELAKQTPLAEGEVQEAESN